MILSARELKALPGAHLQCLMLTRVKDARCVHWASGAVEHGQVDVALAVVLEASGEILDADRPLGRVYARVPGDAVPHRRRRVVVHRSEVPLPVDQLVAHREVLRHAHERVVDRRVAVRAIVAHHLTDDLRRTSHTDGSGRRPSSFIAIQHPAMDGLQPIAHVRQRAADDDRHRVVEIRSAHLLLERARLDASAVQHLGASHCSPSPSDV